MRGFNGIMSVVLYQTYKELLCWARISLWVRSVQDAGSTEHWEDNLIKYFYLSLAVNRWLRRSWASLAIGPVTPSHQNVISRLSLVSNGF